MSVFSAPRDGLAYKIAKVCTYQADSWSHPTRMLNAFV
jgi:hypothetical protein